MTRAISQNSESNQNPDVSSSNDKFKQRKKTCEESTDLVHTQIPNTDEPENADTIMHDLSANNVCGEPQSTDKLVSNMCNDNVHEDLGKAVVTYVPIQSEVKTSEPLSSVGATVSAMDRALKLQENLPQQYPSCLKLMSRSHVSGGFWLSMPKQFCNLHMPDSDSKVILVDENGKAYDTKYLIKKNGLSGGWRGFSIAQGLMESDVVIFQLIEPCKLKVHIVRANRLTKVDGAIGHVNSGSGHSGAKPMDTDSTELLELEKQDHSKQLLALDNNHKENDVGQSGEDDSDVYSSSEVHEGIRFSESVLHFEDVEKFEDFAIHVDGLIIDSEIPAHIRRQYYELCCSQNMFLHSSFIQGLNIKLVIGVISETVNIADAIKQVKSTTSVNDLESWEKTLKAFEDLGMMVGFLLVRIHKLLSLTRDSKAAIETKRRERAEAEIEMRCLTEKLHGVGALVKRLDTEIDALMAKDEDIESVFAEAARGSW